MFSLISVSLFFDAYISAVHFNAHRSDTRFVVRFIENVGRAKQRDGKVKMESGIRIALTVTRASFDIDKKYFLFFSVLALSLSLR
jgi:hypothetical protein